MQHLNENGVLQEPLFVSIELECDRRDHEMPFFSKDRSIEPEGDALAQPDNIRVYPAVTDQKRARAVEMTRATLITHDGT